ncbi:putative aldouronate transport system substrate-binding protein [Cohnella sp. OV330]|uniref:extracellular solute-binding protein n=1 Tax=Cohnella sp. OV330 TaxID=1855288 RepID=UPI0008E602CF|nr:extracellular solute-binding protein [Cohnella sp. OV330]SFB25779.1 putative aldouronate transport system substrate-binding protein [Cohnella sp. OV330]
MKHTIRAWRTGVVAAAVLLLAACQGHGSGDASLPSPSASSAFTHPDANGGRSADDRSEHVDLQFYMLGSAPPDMPRIQSAINEMTEAELNASVTFNFIAWTDYDLKYKQLLSSGQSVDLLFTADWAQYQTYAKRGAFLPLDDLLPAASPALQRFVPQETWDAVRIDGHIYTVPSTFKEYVTGGFVWREDLREKYGLPKPVDIATFEAYLAGIKRHEPDMQPVAIGAEVQNALAFSQLDVTRHSIGSMPYGLLATYANPADVRSYWGSPEQLADLKLFKRWSDLGYFSKNELNTSEFNQDRIIDGSAAAMFGDNLIRYNEALNNMQAAHPDWRLGYYPFPMAKGYATPVHPTHNGFAIPKSAKHPERALAFYEKLVTDERYNRLTEYGIEGVNYTIEDGYYRMIGDTSTNGFPREAMNGWAWRNPEYMLFAPSYDEIRSTFRELDRIQKPDIYTGFAEDDTAYQAEKAALDQVQKLYLYPLLAGLVDDVDAGLATFMKEAKEAGLDKVQAAYKKQWLAYLKERGIAGS